MKKTLVLLALSLSFALPAQSPKARVIPVSLDTDAWNQSVLLKKLNDKGHYKDLVFAATAHGEPFEYRIVFNADYKPVQSVYGELPAHATSVTCYDATGKMLFTFTREGRWTESGAANAASGEIIKRILGLEKADRGDAK